MQILYEEDGELKAGTVLAQAPASLQVETAHGRRAKVKAASVLLRFERPSGTELLAEAAALAATLEVDFLWQCCGSSEFGFEDLAREYVGREPTPAEAAGVLMKLQSAPVYFHRRSRGRFQAAPEETLRLALAALEKKRRVQEQIADWARRLARFECPPEIARRQDELLYAPDRNLPETKAFEAACKETGLSPVHLLARCGAVTDSHAYHLNRFRHEFSAHVAGFPAHPQPTSYAELPMAEAEVFSLDDVGTTEIDDAFSLRRIDDNTLRIGIHIAAPALGFAPGSPLDQLARERLSTAYLPGHKFTMLPEDVIECFSLDHGSQQPVASLYLDVSASDFAVRGRLSRLERVRVGANLRHATYNVLNEGFANGAAAGLAFEDELRTLWKVATALEAKRGKPSVNEGVLDYSFLVEGERVQILPRRRGSPLDKLVSELMIVANTAWGELLAERDVAAIYRVQSYGKVRMSVHAEPHEGLGVSCYAWLTSPLRRYVDLVNQWQLISALSGVRAPFARNSEALLSALRAFETTTARLEEHQRALEEYWCLRWLLQEQVGEIEAVAVRESLVRLEGLPLAARVPSLPRVEAGTRVLLRVDGVDLLERSVALTYRSTLAAPGVDASIARNNFS